MIYAYPCQLTPDEDGGLVATFPDVPEAITGGSNLAEALAMAEDALATALAGYVHEKWDIPTPSEAVDGQVSVPVPTVVAAKLALYSAMKVQRITKVELADRLGVSESAVRKLTNPDHRSHMSQVQKALRAVGRRLKVEVTAA
jgi:antitoxin HicB